MIQFCEIFYPDLQHIASSLIDRLSSAVNREHWSLHHESMSKAVHLFITHPIENDRKKISSNLHRLCLNTELKQT